MDIVQNFSSAFVILLVMVVAAIVWVVVWQLVGISRASRARIRQARADEASDASIRERLRLQGFGDDEIQDALQHAKSGRQGR